MIWRGAAFLIWLLAFPPPLSRQQDVSLSQSSLPMCRRSSLLTGEGGRGWGEAKSYERDKAWPSIDHSILSDLSIFSCSRGCSTGIARYF
jgi:hypothetical protein